MVQIITFRNTVEPFLDFSAGFSGWAFCVSTLLLAIVYGGYTMRALHAVTGSISLLLIFGVVLESLAKWLLFHVNAYDQAMALTVLIPCWVIVYHAGRWILPEPLNDSAIFSLWLWIVITVVGVGYYSGGTITIEFIPTMLFYLGTPMIVGCLVEFYGYRSFNRWINQPIVPEKLKNEEVIPDVS